MTLDMKPLWKRVLEKWFGVWSRGDAERGRTDCAFCDEFFDLECVGCPILFKTGKNACVGTPYEHFDHHKQAILDNYKSRQQVLPDCGCEIIPDDGGIMLPKPNTKCYCEGATIYALGELQFLIRLCPYDDLKSEYIDKIATHQLKPLELEGM